MKMFKKGKDASEASNKKEKGNNRVGRAIDSFLKSGKLFSFFTWVVQCCAEMSVVYAGTFFVAVSVLRNVVMAFGSYALMTVGVKSFADMGIADQFAFFMLPTAFVTLTLFAVAVAVYYAVWKLLNKYLGGMRAKRKAQLQEKYGEKPASDEVE